MYFCNNLYFFLIIPELLIIQQDVSVNRGMLECRGFNVVKLGDRVQKIIVWDLIVRRRMNENRFMTVNECDTFFVI